MSRPPAGLGPASSALDRYWAPDFRQHSALGADGREGLRAVLHRLPEDFRFEPLRTLEDGDMVAVHGVYHGFGPAPMVAVDVFRVVGGRLAEHWDVLEPLPGGPAGAHRIDGPRQITDREHTGANKALITEWAHERLLGADREALAELAGDPRYVEHGAGPDPRLARHTLHRVLGEGDLVLTVTEGVLERDEGGPERGGPSPAGCYDLWRVTDGRILEHWEVVQPVPERMPHGNGFF